MEDWGVPKGSVAKKLRTILYPGLTDHQVETIVVCLMAHLLIEQKVNGLLYRWLNRNTPPPDEDALWEKIVSAQFLGNLRPYRSLWMSTFRKTRKPFG